MLAPTVLASMLLAGGAAGSPARRAEIVPPPFEVVALRTLESDPPQFVLSLRRETPTAGWTVRVDGVDRDGSGDLVVRISEIAPDGMVAQVITPVTVSVPLGRLEVGRHVVRIESRRGPGGEYRPQQMVLIAAGP